MCRESLIVTASVHYLPDFTRIPPWKWWLRDEEGHLVTLTIDYSPFAEESIMEFGLRDMASICNGIREFEHQHPIFEFLNQFEGVERRCPMSYESYTLKFLRGAAQLQKSILSGLPVIPDDLSTHVTLIALLLNCFAVSYRIFDLGCHISLTHLNSPSPCYIILEEAGREESGGLIPFMAVRKQRPTSKLPESLIHTAWDITSTIESTLQRAAQLLLELMTRQDPRDLPMILYALSIMQIVRQNVDFDEFDLIRGIFSHLSNSILSDLCRLYYICTYGGQPLTHNFDREAYANLVYNDPNLLQHCDLLRELWLEWVAEFEEHDSLGSHMGSFHAMMESFVIPPI
ncbi:hypothetical protein FQN54_005901 [Arachnomyces sp. PD_36]|nr:hypothetical protein FQN54_005901 [Arachnomyces sp. PD_36]